MVTVKDDGNVLLRSLNKSYAPYEVNSEDILELWSYYKHQANTLPEPATELQELKEMIINLVKADK